ncbi:hypothetical protein [uncultured Microbulbifer sp.]|uniref:hypothetical protein n=1 Tax=uncultured Microbulbifer sp. TaxID=348147 RepID=UPI002634825C|nr:hypothetical protein [uncultured Microbulbifer sp.]
MPKAVPALTPLATAPGHPAAVAESSPVAEQGLLAQMGGRQFIQETAGEFYQAIGKYLTADDSEDHAKQLSRQAQFLSHAFAGQPEPMHTARANFLARGLNPMLFEALLEYFEARLLEIGFPVAISDRLVRTASDLYDNCQEPLSIAC